MNPKEKWKDHPKQAWRNSVWVVRYCAYGEEWLHGVYDSAEKAAEFDSRYYQVEEVEVQ